MEKLSDGMSITALQVDDNLGHGTKEFLKLEEETSKKFRCKPHQLLESGDKTRFNGVDITQKDKSMILSRQVQSCDIYSLQSHIPN
jgi:hypothetical protein